MEWKEYSSWLMPEWKRTLDADVPEGVLQHFLEQHPCLLPGGAPADGLGHHGAWYAAVVAQPELVSSRKKRVPDFMWLRRDTASNRPVCIEIERPGKPWYTKGGQRTAHLTQALDQIDDWRVWFNTGSNAQQFGEAYLPAGFRHRSLEPRFILIYGRSTEFKPGFSHHDDPVWMRNKRDSIASSDLVVMTFDMLKPSYDLKDHVCIGGRLPLFKVREIPPTFGTGTNTSEGLLVSTGPPEDALGRCAQLSPARREYVAARWGYWRDRALEETLPRQQSLETE